MKITTTKKIKLFCFEIDGCDCSGLDFHDSCFFSSSGQLRVGSEGVSWSAWCPRPAHHTNMVVQHSDSQDNQTSEGGHVTSKPDAKSVSNLSNELPVENSDENSSFQVSMSSHYSTPFDCILLAQAQDLRSDVDNIKLNICNHMKVDPGQFALVTPQGIKNCNVLNKFTLATGILSLVNLSEKVCATINGSRLLDTGSKDSSYPPPSSPKFPLTTVETSLKVIQESLQNLKTEGKAGAEAMFKSIEEQLETLQTSVSQLRRPRSKSDASTPDFLPVPIPKFPVHLDTNLNPPQTNNTSALSYEPMPCTSSYTEGFIDENFSEELLQFLDSHAEEFNKNSERGHGVISFGQPYKYNGAKASSPLSKTFPEQVAKLVEIIQNKDPDSVVNQCLINRYEDENSLLPEHADDEETIVHGSNIFTISLGDTCDVKFKRVDGTNEEIVKSVQGRSMYVMSRSSQTQWTHRIDPSTTSRGLRYSMTFRYVSQNGSEATLIQGDSNTRYLKFGSGKGTFGDRLPGRRKLCFTIDEIDPNACIGYKNVVLHCGINDIRRPQADVRDCATRLIGKLDKISKTCRSSCKIIFSPILPTKLPHLNQKAKMFNQLIFDYINRVNPRIGCLDFNCFLDDSDLLSDRFGRFHDKTDAIHLGSTGIFTLSRVIIEKIRGNLVDGRMFNDVVSANIPNSRRYSSSRND